MKTLIPFVATVFLLSFAVRGYAQPVQIALTRDHILNGKPYFQTLTSGFLEAGTYSRWTRSTTQLGVTIRATATNFTNASYTLPTTMVQFQLASIANYAPGSLELATEWPIPQKQLSNNPQYFLKPPDITSSAPSGDIKLHYSISNPELTSKALHAGTYTTNIQHNQPGGRGLFRIIGIAPKNGWQMNMVIPGINEWTHSSLTSTQNLNLADFAGADYEIDLSHLQIGHTLPAYIDIKAVGAINYTPAGGGVSATRPLSLLKITSPSAALGTKTLSNTYQTLNNTALPVIVGNKTAIPLKIKILAKDLASYFFMPGTYTLSLNIRTRNQDNTVADTKTIGINIVTNAIGNIQFGAGNQAVEFNFLTAADYQSGISVDMQDHILITNNNAFQVYVKSTSDYFTLNATPTSIPVSIVRIGNGTGETQILSKPLSTTPQNIIGNASPVLKRQLSIKYTIPPSQTGILFNKPTGVPYLTNVVYSFTNL